MAGKINYENGNMIINTGVADLGFEEETFTDLIDQYDINLPRMMPLKNGRGQLFKISGERGRKNVIKLFQGLILRLLATSPPNEAHFTFIDPVAQGGNVSQFMQINKILREEQQTLIGKKAWSRPADIEKELGKLTDHIERVIQEYLHGKYNDIFTYNREAAAIAEPLRFVVIFDFPANFEGRAPNRLLSIVQNGPRCGVFPLIMLDENRELPHDFNLSVLEEYCDIFTADSRGFIIPAERPELRLTPDRLPGKHLQDRIIKEVSQKAIEAMKVEVPVTELLEMSRIFPEDFWEAGGVEKGLEIPLGQEGANEVRSLRVGFKASTNHHALIAGQTGSGKTNLMHVIITNASLIYSPEELEIYLIDFKEGVEFKRYADLPLPQARVVAIESEREFGLSVLEGLSEEMERRGQIFREHGVSDLAAYLKEDRGKMPRILLLIDEFQELFVEDDNISRRAEMILDKLVSKGRGFGIHVILGSQTLAGSHGLPQSTMSQMGIRIALQCGEADSRLVLADDNPAARYLSRAGEAIYNAGRGLVESNKKFQVAFFEDQEHQNYLEIINELEGQKYLSGPETVVFEGNRPAEISKSGPLQELIAEEDWSSPRVQRAFLGEPVSLQPSVSIPFRRQSGGNLLVVERKEELGIGIMTAALLSLTAQISPRDCRIYLVDFTSYDSDWHDLSAYFRDKLPHQIEVVGRRDLPDLLAELSALADERFENEDYTSPSRYLLLEGLQRARDLRHTDDDYAFNLDQEETASPLQNFKDILRNGPEVGIHTLVWCDLYGNLMRALDRRSLREFAVRVAGRMSEDDSMNLIDSPAAGRFKRENQAMLMDEDQPGHLVKFRPYRLPAKEWLQDFVLALQDKK